MYRRDCWARAVGVLLLGSRRGASMRHLACRVLDSRDSVAIIRGPVARLGDGGLSSHVQSGGDRRRAFRMGVIVRLAARLPSIEPPWALSSGDAELRCTWIRGNKGDDVSVRDKVCAGV